ncbi:PEP/pyruvate-binding domain-containing protein [Anaerolinea sp.]|uniref:PEP/pyruvate-binding domain-containing protein n=1 Tax=Anaerolinea sp. TaxID=1872519 RepID=UPI002ACDD5B2|nr:PEP/pyruvate-binding domain-containing protein [Anaerolinea sp.]
MTAFSPKLVSFYDSSALSLDLSGGKGANLAKLAQAGFPVPQGMILTTPAYLEFVLHNQLEDFIRSTIASLSNPTLEELEKASEAIRAQFRRGQFPDHLKQELLSAYQRMGMPPVAVRSSATTEDLPDLSFAGQQDTFLNVRGETSLLKATIKCWSSLWTARAIGYRLRNQLPQENLALAVIVQSMVESEVSGVMFTANPLTGLRREVVINAILGLGEALVSGRSEPDEYLVQVSPARIISKRLGAKALSLKSESEGGLQEDISDRSSLPALSDTQILALAEMGKQIERLYAFPQDIEWAIQKEQIYILQSRPITSLYPLPENLPEEPLHVFFSVGAVQGMLDPITPLGRDTFAMLFAAGAGLFGYRFTHKTQRALFSAGERLWANITPILRTTFGRKAACGALGWVEPSTRNLLEVLLREPGLQSPHPIVRPITRLRLARFLIPVGFNALLNVIAPHPRRRQLVSRTEALLQQLDTQFQSLEDLPPAQALEHALTIASGYVKKNLPHVFVRLVSIVATGVASLNLIRILCKHVPEGAEGLSREQWTDLPLELTRGLPYNPTTEMDLQLWKIASRAKEDPLSNQMLEQMTATDLAQAYLQHGLPEELQQSISQFLQRYGRRGLAEIDLGRERWKEDPTHIFEVLKSFQKINAQDLTPEQVFTGGEEKVRNALNLILRGVRHTRMGFFKAHIIQFLASRLRALMGMREYPKFFAVRLMGAIRDTLLHIGEQFVQQGFLRSADDVFYLTYDELAEFSQHPEDSQWREIITQRRHTFEREKRRRQIPRLLLSDGRVFYDGIANAETTHARIPGNPVSPGVVEGKVRIVLNPKEANLQPGEILVCPGTDPSWTPLFLSAAGLVMEVGGMMTHGAVVAREYGIPAVVGVARATQRLKTGQRIRVNGSTGWIDLLEEEP